MVRLRLLTVCLGFLALTASDPAHAQAPAPTGDPKFDLAVKLIAEDMKPFIKTLSRSVTVFHWAARVHEMKLTARGSLPLKDPGAIQHANNWRQSVYRSGEQSEGNFGYGLYGAMDPFISANFAGFWEWGMLSIELAAGTQFLDIRRAVDKLPISPRVTRFLKDGLCPKLDTRQTMSIAGKKFVLVDKNQFATQAPRCHDAWTQAVHSLQLGFLFYDWETGISFRECSGVKLGGAVVILDAPLTDQTVSLFVSEDPESSDQQKMDAYRHVHRLASQPGNNKPDRLHWSRFSDENASNSEIQSWMKEHLLTCESKEEDLPIEDSALRRVLNTAYKRAAKLIGEFR